MWATTWPGHCPDIRPSSVVTNAATALNRTENGHLEPRSQLGQTKDSSTRRKYVQVGPTDHWVEVDQCVAGFGELRRGPVRRQDPVLAGSPGVHTV
jgi:hypothetical protein